MDGPTDQPSDQLTDQQTNGRKSVYMSKIACDKKALYRLLLADVNKCASSPCVRGDCEDGIDTFICHCPEGLVSKPGNTINSMKAGYFL